MSFTRTPFPNKKQTRPKRRRLFRSDPDSAVLNQDSFDKALCLERKRTDRSGRNFALMLFDFCSLTSDNRVETQFVEKVIPDFRASIRETDVLGWYEQSVLGLILTELCDDAKISCHCVLTRLRRQLEDGLGDEGLDPLRVSVHHYPEDRDGTKIDLKLYPDLESEKSGKPPTVVWKRLLDITASLMLLIVLSPLFGIITYLVRRGSEGPAFFEQERIGQLGKPFNCFKFRSMRKDSDSSLHENFVGNFIESNVSETAGVYKLTDDPRITRIGKFLRKTSLDELPQLINVLKGEMSLVGPRPPLRYELQKYSSWHRRRVLEAKPGMTGIWQLWGRSRTTFDEMVRMDLEYIRELSLWLDLKILLLTPWVVLRGRGAY